ncbi:FKBP-type peptidyl-prolyl cis-trans isomerase [Belliella kenyensis]|uniref:Peptidyl-prolyl cis-trans isomerase n=1 Tax=Belliella kenyensis TaxID=1472724 RepID=A0ABV8EIS6_9BACT|nr:FKBP-type peptidyl-prolyl cis-trans isomerase [Belliella kenyensis]MCH7403700.1 FKBP-type peptidyl-prolyl cis-trans isomerase [Belliella kenyensis]MDN3603467.1 FKBP-type peptidyl-prolyl cis-trans isomerase [Belliella kenyensis]
MRKLQLLLLIPIIAFISCEERNPFGPPPYDVEGNLARDRGIIDDYLANTPIDSLYRIHDRSGVIVIVQEEGTGSRPITNSVVYTNYIGSLLDGSIFDTNIESVARENDLHTENRTYVPLVFTIPELNSTGSTIQGFGLGFRRLRSGSKGVLIIPSPYGYRNSESNENIPPNSVLRFDVEFLGLD